LAWRGVLAGTVLAFARALGEFGATVMLAGNIPAAPRPWPWPSSTRRSSATTTARASWPA
jgi:ABC-type molybdate transport system permease subunit